MQGSGDQKFVPAVPHCAMESLATTQGARLLELYEEIGYAMLTAPPYVLGFPNEIAQSAYYPGNDRITKEEIAIVSQALEENAIFPENTRVCKTRDADGVVYKVLVASTKHDLRTLPFSSAELQGRIKIRYGDHSEELTKIRENLQKASGYAANKKQLETLRYYDTSLETGNLSAYREALKQWIQDKSPRVEHILGFVEPYRDPYGVRAEFESLVAINDTEETQTLLRLVEQSSTFIKRLPWAGGEENDGKGHFEKALFEPPDLTSIHSKVQFPDVNFN